MRVLVIIPTYNERENLIPLVGCLLELHPALDVLIVDDASPDGTGALADALAQQTGRVHVIHRSGKQGLGTAYVTGFRFALAHDYDLVVEMDADFSHRPSDLPRLLEAAARADVVIGSRYVPGGQAVDWSLLRRCISRGGSLWARLVLGLPVHDATSGFKCFRRRALEVLDLDAIRSNGYAFQVEVNYLCYRRGFRIREVPIVFVDRRVGKSKMSTGIVLEAMLMVLKYRLFGSPAEQPRHRSPEVSASRYSDIPPE